MIRVLVIGRAAADLGEQVVSNGIEIETFRLPVAGIRRLDESPPDLVVVADGPELARVSAICDAVRSRPLGALTPIVAIGSPSDDSGNVDAWLSSADGHGFEELVAELLGVEIGQSLETRTKRSAPATQPTPSPRPESGVAPGEAELNETLRRVRHENYFVILGVPESASAQQIKDAHHANKQKWRDSVVGELSTRFAEQLAEIRDGLDDAFLVLADAGLRAEYQRHLDR